MWGITRYQWTVLFAAWLGWGFDVFDGLLFNYVAPNCIPTLLHLPVGSPEARIQTLHWTGILTSLLLLGWAAGGVLFGAICDRIGRLRTLMLTMLLYAVGTAACAGATNLWMLAIFRLVASLGIGGEWAAGASMVAEVMPEKRRVEGGALLYTAAPFGLFLATFINYQVAGVWFANNTEQSWRYVFLFGLLPATFAFIVRLFVHEPERWESVKSRSRARVREIFTPQLRRTTYAGTLTVVIALIGWWSCSAFIPVIASGLARTAAEMQGLDKGATQSLIEHWKVTGTMAFNIGGLLGTLADHPDRQAPGPAADVCALLRSVGGRLLHDVRPRHGGARRACSCSSSLASRCLVSLAPFPTTCRSCSRRGCARPAPDSATTSAGCWHRWGHSWWARRRPVARRCRQSSTSASRRSLGLVLAPLIIETRGGALSD